MSATGRFINWSSVSFTPTGGSAIPIKGVKTITLNPNSTVLKESGDGDLFNTFAGVVGVDYSVSIDVINTAVLNAVAPGTFGVLTFTLNDARNAATSGGGALVYTVSNCVYNPQTLTGQHRQMATNGYQFETYSTDGQTSPVAVAAA